MSPETTFPPPRFIGSEIYRGSSYGGWHPLRVPRVSTVMDLSRALGWLPEKQYITSPRAKPRALAAFHTLDYIAALQQAEKDQAVSEDVRARHNIGTVSNPVFPEVFRRPATSSGGAILAGELIKDGGVIFVPGAGTHHAFPDYANGFCYFNDPVLGILSLRHHGARRIVYVDIDAHHCDGVEAAFAGDPDTVLISVHEENRWPRTGALEVSGVGNLFNLPVPRGMHDDDMALILDQLILPVVDHVRPDAIVLQCGSDAITEDPQSKLCLSNNAHCAVAEALMERARRFLVLGGGGYNPWSVGRCWTAVWGVVNGWSADDELPEQACQVLADLEWFVRDRRKMPEPQWVSTLHDAPRGGPISGEIRRRVSQLTVRLKRWT